MPFVGTVVPLWRHCRDNDSNKDFLHVFDYKMLIQKVLCHAHIRTRWQFPIRCQFFFQYVKERSLLLWKNHINGYLWSVGVFFLISANTPFSLRRVPLSRAEVMPVDEKCGRAASERDFC